MTPILGHTTRPSAYNERRGALFMCRCSRVGGFALLAAGAGVLITLALPEGFVTVLAGLALLFLGCMLLRRR